MTANNRFRFRARLRLLVTSTDEARAGLRVATGNPNVTGSLVRSGHAPLSFTQLIAKAHVINSLDRAISNAPLVGNPTLVRTQFDASVRFKA